MAKALTAVGIALVLLIGGLGAAVYFTRDEDYIAVDNVLSEELSKQLNTAEDRGDDVDLAQAAPFPWDHVAVAERGLEPADIAGRLGTGFNARQGVQTGDLLLFLRGGRVVRFAEYRGYGRMDLGGDLVTLPRDRAVLRVRDLTIRLAPRAAASGKVD